MAESTGKTIAQLEKLVAKRREMLDAAYRIQAEANHRVERREEILAEHEALLEAARQEAEVETTA